MINLDEVGEWTKYSLFHEESDVNTRKAASKIYKY